MRAAPGLTLIVVDPTVTAVLAGGLGLLVGAVAVLAFWYSERQQTAVPPRPEPELPRGVAEVLSVLDSGAIVVDSSERVVKASPAAYAFGLVRAQQVVAPELLAMVEEVRRSGEIQEQELALPRGPLGLERRVVAARVAPLGAQQVLLLVADRTEARRVEEVRRDFVANVSHELKTPVGALALLAEATADAADDPDAVRRFASRMQRESERLTLLVQEIIDLSRLQSAAVLTEPVLVELDEVVAEAVDRCRLSAEAHDVSVEVAGPSRARVYGDRELLVTAVRNLVDNAVRYSESGTRIGVGVRRGGGLVEVAVTDQGVGIAQRDLARVFERFYRVDPARSRSTGGTGLGLSIVKHVAANHGGDVTVWSRPGAGSTFTLRLPDAADPSPGDARARDDRTLAHPARGA